MRFWLLSICSILASGCQLTQANEAVPAVLITPGAEVKTELQHMIQQAIGGLPVKLADDVLTQRSTLYIEQQMAKDARGNPIMGRHHHKPEVFRLQVENGRCQLVHGASGKVFILQKASCRALDAQHPLN